MRPATTCLGFVAALLFAAATTAGAGEVYKIDPAHTHIGFGVKHFTVSTVKGDFHDFTSDIVIDEENLTGSKIEVTIEAASIDTGNEQRDGHLRSEDFLFVDKHPQITFKSTRIAKTGLGLQVMGDLTIRGVTRQVGFLTRVAGPIDDPLGMKRIGVSFDLEIDRKNFGMEWNRTMDTGGLIVGEEVAIEVEAELVRPKEEAPSG